MGRTLKRVPLDFNWPIGQIWSGYLNPHYVQCPDCPDGIGHTAAHAALEHLTHLILCAGAQSVNPTGRLHPWLCAAGVEAFPSPDMAELTGGLSGRAPRGLMGHDALDRWKATAAIIRAAGLDPDVWGKCPTCKGEGIHPDHYAAHEAWERQEPPDGEGYQLWSTTTEGHPMTPVFATLDELCEWCEKQRVSVFGTITATKQEWLDMLGRDLVVCEKKAGDTTLVFI